MTDRLPVRAVLRDSSRYEAAAPRLVHGRIVDFGPIRADAPPWIAIPGLRNAHVHLDLSLARGVPRATRGFGAWVLDLIRARGSFDAGQLQRAAEVGAAECLGHGTTSVGDIDSSGAAASAVAKSGLKGVSFRELLGTRDPGAAARGAREWIESFPAIAPGGRTRPGVSPHAPYSTPAALYRAAAILAHELDAPYTTHVAETHAEARFVGSGDGEFAQLLATLGAALPFEAPPATTPLSYLAELGGLFEGALLAHANYPAPAEFELLRASGATVVYCPRSHNFFGHSRHPVREYLDAGVRVALGTDSLASNSSLSMFDEMAFLRASRPDLATAEILRMATEVAAPVLDGGKGRLDLESAADLVLLAFRQGVPATLDQALEAVTSGTAEVVATLVDGRVCFVRAGAEAWLLPLT